MELKGPTGGYLTCIHCNHEFEHKEIFTAFMDEKGFIVVASCLDRGHPVNSTPERPHTGWCILQREYDKYEWHKLKKSL